MAGPGTHLKRILKRYFRIKAGRGCKCEPTAKEMDRKGCEWSWENREPIVDVMQAEAKQRKLKLVFTRLGARQLLRVAIKLARRDERE